MALGLFSLESIVWEVQAMQLSSAFSVCRCTLAGAVWMWEQGVLYLTPWWEPGKGDQSSTVVKSKGLCVVRRGDGRWQAGWRHPHQQRSRHHGAHGVLPPHRRRRLLQIPVL